MYKETFPSQFGIFSQPCFNRIFSNCLSHNSPAKGWPYRFLSRGMTGSSILDHDLGHLCRCRRIQMSGHSDFGIFLTICEHLPFSLGYKLILRLLLVHRNLVIWVWYPWFRRPSFEMLKILVQWVLHKTPNRLLQYHLGEQLDLCIFGVLPPIQRFSNDICPLVMQNELLRPSSLLHRSPLSYFWLSSGSTPKFCPIFHILCPPLLLLQEFS